MLEKKYARPERKKMPDYSNLSVLIVDPNQGMRASVHNMLTQVNITKVEHAVSAGTAIRALNKRDFDLGEVGDPLPIQPIPNLRGPKLPMPIFQQPCRQLIKG